MHPIMCTYAAIMHEGSSVLKAVAPVIAMLCPRLHIGELGV